MPKQHSLLRSLVLVFLSGWLGITAQPAEAQQTVTLSGRVTDFAGQAVSGAFVSLQRLPGYIWLGGHETDGNGAYRFSMPLGTYRLEVLPRRGPLIPERRELTLSTNTTQDIVLESGVTVSGRVTSPEGQPVDAWLSFHNLDEDQESSWGGANESGRYSLGMPVGTYQINVYHHDFLNPKLEGVEITQDTVLNITLESGVLLEGKAVDDAGQPVPDAQVCVRLQTERPWEHTCFQTDPTGGFRLRVPPAVYVLTVTPLAPLQPTRRRLEVGSQGVSNMVLTVGRQPVPFVPDDPPKAALISMSSPTADGEVTLTGAAGSVAPHSVVVAVTLNTGHFTTVQATASGSFSVTLFAPAGTSVLIKADPVGTSVAEFLANDLNQGGGEPVEHISALPGTILRVADPPGMGIPIGGAGRTAYDSFPTWTFHGSIPANTPAPGDPLRVQGTVRVDSPVLQGVNGLQVHATLILERLSDPQGSSLLRLDTLGVSTLLTPTGLPIERGGETPGLSQYQEAPLVKTASTQAEARLNLTLPLPSDVPAGYYHPILRFDFPEMPIENPPKHLKRQESLNSVDLPIIKVGNPAPPRLYWPLLLDTLSNGSRGVVAEEDAARFGIAQRILTSSETFVIPRLDAASGQALPYRLEPFAPTVSLVNTSFGGLPLLPRIPFRFPSGNLTVTIHQPDGTERVLGPAPFVQSRLKSLASEDGIPLDTGGGHITDAYQPQYAGLALRGHVCPRRSPRYYRGWHN